MWATDMGWIMGPWMVLAGLANGAALATYDGAPDHPGPDRLWAVVANLGVTFSGSHPLSSAPCSPTAPSMPVDMISPGSTRSARPANHGTPSPGAGSSKRSARSRGRSSTSRAGPRSAPLSSVSTSSRGSSRPRWAALLSVDADIYDADGNPVREDVGELVIGDPGRAHPRLLGRAGALPRDILVPVSRRLGAW